MKFRIVFLLAAIASVGCPSPQAQNDKPDEGDGALAAKEEAKSEIKEDEAPAAKPTLKEGAKVFFKQPVDGATVTSPVKIEFGIEGAEVKPAGEDVPNSGHHHLIINGNGMPAATVMPAAARTSWLGSRSRPKLSWLEAQKAAESRTVEPGNVAALSDNKMVQTALKLSVWFPRADEGHKPTDRRIALVCRWVGGIREYDPVTHRNLSGKPWVNKQ